MTKTKQNDSTRNNGRSPVPRTLAVGGGDPPVPHVQVEDARPGEAGGQGARAAGALSAAGLHTEGTEVPFPQGHTQGTSCQSFNFCTFLSGDVGTFWWPGSQSRGVDPQAQQRARHEHQFCVLRGNPFRSCPPASRGGRGPGVWELGARLPSVLHKSHVSHGPPAKTSVPSQLGSGPAGLGHAILSVLPNTRQNLTSVVTESIVLTCSMLDSYVLPNERNVRVRAQRVHPHPLVGGWTRTRRVLTHTQGTKERCKL